MNIDSLRVKIKRSWDRNIPALRAYHRRLYPEFVFRAHPKTLKGELPVFTFHFVEPETFEEQLQFLAENDYRTLKLDEFYRMMIGLSPTSQRSVLLTFDDGWRSLWTHAYPLLKKYGMHGVGFIIPGMIPEDRITSPSLSDIWRGKVSTGAMVDSESCGTNLCTWNEIRQMAESGVIEFQSHTMYHLLVFTSPKIVDFLYPFFDTYANNLNVPIYRRLGRDNVKRDAEWGTPIYTYAPRMGGKRRYFDDEELRLRCLDFVKENGGRDFFKERSWRRRLNHRVGDYRKRVGDRGHYETAKAQQQEILWELVESKRLIERKLPGTSVQHLCYPYFIGSNLAIMLSRKAGYKCNFWGTLNHRRSNQVGDDPYRIVRIPEEFLFRLPGRGRKSLLEVVGRPFIRSSLRFMRNLVKGDDQVQ